MAKFSSCRQYTKAKLEEMKMAKVTVESDKVLLMYLALFCGFEFFFASSICLSVYVSCILCIWLFLLFSSLVL